MIFDIDMYCIPTRQTGSRQSHVIMSQSHNYKECSKSIFLQDHTSFMFYKATHVLIPEIVSLLDQLHDIVILFDDNCQTLPTVYTCLTNLSYWFNKYIFAIAQSTNYIKSSCLWWLMVVSVMSLLLLDKYGKHCFR